MFDHKRTKTEETLAGALKALQRRAMQDQLLLDYSIDQHAPDGLARVHKTRVELDCDLWDEHNQAMRSYLAERPEITDIVFCRKNGLVSALSHALWVVKELQTIPHLSAFRLRCFELLYSPEMITRPVISRIASRNRLSVICPKRIELEIQVLHWQELTPRHESVIRQLRKEGITVYNNTPLLGYINDHGDDCMRRLVYACRDIGVEMNNVVVAGLPIQNEWNESHPIEVDSVIDIATEIRRHLSGRGVPRYVLRTRLGEIDFSLAPRIFVRDGELNRVRMRPHNLELFRGIDPKFAWPQDVVVDSDGFPLVPILGLSWLP